MDKMIKTAACACACALVLAACVDTSTKPPTDPSAKKSGAEYGQDAQFMRQHAKQVFELQDVTGVARVLVVADYQGRVMTSTASGDTGHSFGWINYDLIASPEKKKQFNPFGGEERFWLGPEGGQFALYFKQGDSFEIANWQVPPIIDIDAYTVAEADSSHAVFTKHAVLTNYSGAKFEMEIRRGIFLLDKEALERKLGTALPASLRQVAYESRNELTNAGNTSWTKLKGLISIWLLGMMTPTNETRVIIPFKSTGDSSRQYITDNYFGKIQGNRLLIKDSLIYFRCDGKSRGKIGLSPEIAKPIAASFDFKNNVLTVVIPEIHRGAPYVNSRWQMQPKPYSGDVINSYNDGPLADGSQLGPFYEIESSSPAIELAPGRTMTYNQTTCHITGDYVSLKALVKSLTGADLDELRKW